MLDLARIESGQVQLEAQRFDLEEVMILVCPQASQQNTTLKLVWHPEAPQYIEADSVRTRQILTNLLSNAVKFTQGGAIGVSVGWEADVLQVSVQDTGIGMSPSALENLFEAFTQADASTTRRFGGSGLGLTISRNLARIMGGDISVTSQLGEGSVFTLHMPTSWYAAREPCGRLNDVQFSLGEGSDPLKAWVTRVLKQAGATVSEGASVEVSLNETTCPHRISIRGPHDTRTLAVPFRRNTLIEAVEAAVATKRNPLCATEHTESFTLRVLVVDDNSVNRMVASRILTRLGVEHRVVDGGLAAVDACAAELFDLVLMDVQMPEVDGLEATRRIRAAGGNVPVIIALTANALAEHRQKAIEAGMDDYLAKPVRLEDLAATLRKYQ